MALPVQGDVYGTRVKEEWVAPLMFTARFFLAFEFMLYGIRKFLHPDNIAAVIGSHGLPSELIHAVYPFQFFLGWAVFFEILTRPASLGLFGFCVFAPAIFWANSLDNFTRDLSAAGGWMFLAVFGAGAWSVDAKVKLPFQNIFGPTTRDDTWLPTLLAASRAFISISFILRGLRDAALGSASPSALYFTAQGWPEGIVTALAFIQVAGGLMILFGWRTKLAALALCLYSLFLALTMHSISGDIGLGEKSFVGSIDALLNNMGSMISSFGKDLGTAGACLVLYVWGPGPMSLDAKFGMGGKKKAAA